ncbi:MAG: serpin family protein [Candidatus Marinimicrobia bacterium]|nr:serpin family protein [Candidatus Neomarinimicrobiota bacterium]
MKKLCLFIIVLVFFSACSWFDGDQTGQQGIAQFGVSNASLQKSQTTPAPDHVRISYMNAASELISDELNLSLFNTTYLSEPLQLNTGDYSLEEFIVCDENDSVIYLSPKTGSDKADLVSQPLPFLFTIHKDSTIQIIPQVIRVDMNDTPEDFGYTEFGFDIVGDNEGFARCMNQFGLDLFKYLAANPIDSVENNFISPTSIAYAFGMFYNGTGGTTADMLKSVMHFDGYTDNEINAMYKQYKEYLYDQGNDIEIALAQAIWYQPGYEPLSSYLATCRYYFESEVSELDFAGDPYAAADTINQWASDNTHERIKQIVSASDLQATVMALANATYFKGPWYTGFETSSTSPQPFYASDGSVENCDMMSSGTIINISRFHDETVEVVSLPFGEDQNYAMTLIMPTNDIDDFVASLEISDWDSWMDNSQDESIFLSVPKMKIEASYSLKKVMQYLGASVLFTAPDLSRMTTAGGLFVGNILHKTFLSVDEEGAEAAAVTVILIDFGIHDNDSVIFNKPFLLVIQEVGTKAILFIGRMDKVEQITD